MEKLLVIDNYDSFTFNLVQMFRRYPLDIRVFRSDRISLEQADSMAPDYILISPGPKDPASAGISKALISVFYTRTPILGVCLGMQCINEVFGGKTVRAPVPVHGKTSVIDHTGHGLFSGVRPGFRAARYHSLMVEPPTTTRRPQLEITARSEDRVIMGLSHPRHPLHGVQFHPESFLTEDGPILIKNFLASGSLGQTAYPTIAAEVRVDHEGLLIHACA